MPIRIFSIPSTEMSNFIIYNDRNQEDKVFENFLLFSHLLIKGLIKELPIKHLLQSLNRNILVYHRYMIKIREAIFWTPRLPNGFRGKDACWTTICLSISISLRLWPFSCWAFSCKLNGKFTPCLKFSKKILQSYALHHN